MAMSRYNRGEKSDESYELEGRIIRSTPKAFLIHYTNTDKEVWTPKSQCEQLEETNGSDLTTFRVRGWFAEKEELV